MSYCQRHFCNSPCHECLNERLVAAIKAQGEAIVAAINKEPAPEPEPEEPKDWWNIFKEKVWP